MKFIVALFTLVVVCCTQTLAQELDFTIRHPIDPQWPSSVPTWRYPRFDRIFRGPEHVTDDFGTTPPTIPGGGGGAGTFPLPMPGGLQEVIEITQEHMDLAKFAATEIGSEYTLNNVTRVQTQVVGGITYHMDISVTKTKGLVQISLNCEVKIYDNFMVKTLTEFKCTRV